MNLLVITKRYYTNRDLIKDRFGRLYHFPRVLGSRGHSVTVLAIDYKTQRYDELAEGGLHMVSFPSKTSGVFLSLSRIRELSDRRGPFDAVIASGHLHIARHGRRLARRLNIPFIFEAYDFYPAYLPRGARGIGKRFFNGLCNSADGCIAASQNLEDYMRKYSPSVSKVENGFDPTVFHPGQKQEAILELGLDPNKQYVSFIGTATESLGFADLMEAMQIVRRRIPGATLLHLGFMKPGLFETPEVTSLGARDQLAVATALSASSCAVVPYKKTLQVEYSNSCKLVEYMAMGVPVVATRTGDNMRVLGRTFPGLVEPEDAGSLAAAILSQLEEPVLAPYPEKWAWEKLGNLYEAFVLEILRRNKT